MNNLEALPSSSENILIVDDSPVNLSFLTDLLEWEGYEVRQAGNGEQALRAVQALLPDLILLDIQLPDMNGYEICGQLKESEHTQNIPVIFISGATPPFETFKSFRVGGVDHISKPFDPNEVLARVATQLSLWRTKKILIEKNRQLQAEINERKRAEAALRKSEEKFRDLVENINDVIYEIDKNGNLTYVSPVVESISGYTQEEITGRNVFDFICDEDISRMRQQLEKIFSGAREPSQYRFLKKSGEMIWCRFSSRLIHENGQIIGLRGSFTDITKTIQLETELRQAQKMEAIGTLAGGVAHDFNNILFPIVGFSELLMEDLSPESREHENVAEIYKAARRAGDLVKQILSFSRQAENIKMPVRIQQILKEAIKLARATIPSNIKITQSIQNDCSPIMADPTQLHQIAINLITNAYHAVEQEGGDIFIALRVSNITGEDIEGTPLDPGSYAVMSISDTGHGIESSVMGKIFQPYFTTKKQGKGTGLGLSVVYGIVKAHGGDIRVTSEEGKGTTFNVYLPLLQDASDTVSSDTSVICEMGIERILLVDDEEPIVRLEQKTLERLGYQITARTSSVEALEAFRANPAAFDLVITDMTMPNMMGDQFAKKLMAIKPGIPVIICTGFSEKMSPEKSDRLGIKGFLMKPVVKSEMARMVRNVLDAYHQNSKMR
jgi:PAS domain S-box-containing protein